MLNSLSSVHEGREELKKEGREMKKVRRQEMKGEAEERETHERKKGGSL